MAARNIKMIIQYVGTRYHGWQVQENAISIQQLLEEKLSLILDERIRVIGAGRTDTGVHALAQVANFRTKNVLNIKKIFKGVNSLLPSDIAVLSMRDTDAQFNARKDASRKEYCYQIWNAEIISPFLAPFAKHAPYRLDREAMKDAAGFFHGRHDFTSFCSSRSAVKDKVRNVYFSSCEVAGNMIRYRIVANGFLQHMVRTIVGTLINVGKTRIQKNDIVDILKARDRRQAGFAAPAKGLFLVRVDYERRG